MGNFVSGNPALPSLKTDLFAPTGIPQECAAADINNLWAAAGDLRDQVQGWVNVKSSAYGAIGNGSADDTAAFTLAIAAAPAGGRVRVPVGTYLVSGITIAKSLTFDMEKGATLTTTATAAITVSNATGVIIRGGAITLGVNASAQFAIQLSGVVTDLTIEDVTISGTGIVPDGSHGIQTGIGGLSGQTLTFIKIVKCRVFDMNNGISLNADTSGSIAFALVDKCHVKNMVGTVTGQGYGIHHANGSGNPSYIRIAFCSIEAVQRHSIYQAKGIGVSIVGNHIKDHRLGVGDGTERPAIHIGRSKDVSVVSNVIEAPSDGAFSAFTDDPAFPLSGVTFVANIVRNWKLFPALTVGDPSPGTGGTISHVSMVGNEFFNDLAVSGASGGAAEAIRIYYGTDITVEGGSMEMLNSPSASNMVTLYAQGETAGTATYSDNLKFIGVPLTASGTATRAFRFDTAMCAAGTRAEFIACRVIGFTNSFSVAATHLNTNVYALHTPVDGLDVTKLHAIDGNLIFAAGTGALSSLSTTGNIIVGGHVIASSGAATLSMRGQAPDSSGSFANRLGNSTALTVAGAKIASFFSDNFSTERAFVDLLGRGSFFGGVSPGTDAGAAQTGKLLQGSGVPNNANGNNGDYYFRTDTPGTASQRIYVKSAGSWAGIV